MPKKQISDQFSVRPSPAPLGILAVSIWLARRWLHGNLWPLVPLTMALAPAIARRLVTSRLGPQRATS